MKKWIGFLVCLCLYTAILGALERGSSAPYISGDTFRAYCDFTFDELNKMIDPGQVKEGHTIFVKTDYLKEFFSEVHPRIPSRYILVTHNSDNPIPAKFKRYLRDKKLLAWFGQNLSQVVHPKLHPIPIGLANRCWPHGNVDIFNKVAQMAPNLRKSLLLYMNFQVGTYADERSKVANMFKNKPYCFVAAPKEYEAYLTELAQAKFALSPRGNGLDTHRTWECLLVGTIPIVKTSSLDPLFANLPVLIVQDWSEINENFLLKKEQEMRKKKYRLEKAYSDYWLHLIESYKP
jgi:hypothetical protein